MRWIADHLMSKDNDYLAYVSSTKDFNMSYPDVSYEMYMSNEDSLIELGIENDTTLEQLKVIIETYWRLQGYE